VDRRSWLIVLSIAVAALAASAMLRAGSEDLEAGEPTTTTAVASATATTPTTTTTQAPASTLAPGESVCDRYGAVSIAGTVESSALVEASGIAASRATPGVLWAHNDSRDGPVVYAIGSAGEDLGSVTLDGAEAFDWEDIAIGAGPDPGRSYLYVGDIGDNFGIRRGRITVYRLLEPDQSALGAKVPVEASIVMNTTDGPHDFEALFVDAGSIYLVTKDATLTTVYRNVPPLDGALPTTLELIAALDLGAEVTAADVSWDGSTIAFRGYGTIWMWHRDPDQTIDQAILDEPCTTSSPDEPQGEALGFLSDGSVTTVSEGSNPDLNVIKRIP
jgi:hypothetical protein